MALVVNRKCGVGPGHPVNTGSGLDGEYLAAAPPHVPDSKEEGGSGISAMEWGKEVLMADRTVSIDPRRRHRAYYCIGRLAGSEANVLADP